jgi:F-type H+-transporting ATPase subunit epsilon
VEVSIVSPEKELWRGEADLVIGRSPEGEFGIMQGHIPFLAALVPGTVTIVSGEGREVFFVPGGFLEASGSGDDYHTIVLADDAKDISNLSEEEARRMIEDSQRESTEDKDETTEAEARAAMARVQAATR